MLAVIRNWPVRHAVHARFLGQFYYDVDSGASTYVHNGQGQRVEKDNGTVSLFAYDEVGGLVGEYDSLGTAVQETVWFNGAPISVLEGGNRYYIHTDQLGAPRAITDGNTVIWRWHSDPFGASVPDENPDGDANTFTYNLRFAGQYYDVETQLHYNYFRTYDPSTGRYLESDPLGLYAGPNTYGYVGGNPLRFTDRTGQCPWCIVGGLIGGGLNAYMQVYHGDGTFDWRDFAAATAIGAVGGGLGTVTKGLSFGRSLAANSIGSGAAAAGITAAQNRIFGSCKNVGSAGLSGLLGGALGSAGGSAISNGISALSRARYLGVPLSARTLLTSNALHVPSGAGLEPLGVTAGDIAANAISNLPSDLASGDDCECSQ